MDNSTTIYFIVLLLLIIAAAYALFRNQHIRSEETRGGKGSVLGARNEKLTEIIEIENFAFHPDNVEIKPGTVVVWVNKDDVNHNVQSEIFSSPDILPGGSFSSIFEIKGVYDYYCSIHPSMKGRIVVKD